MTGIEPYCWLNLDLVGGNCRLMTLPTIFFFSTNHIRRKKLEMLLVKILRGEETLKSCPNHHFPRNWADPREIGPKKAYCILSFRRPPNNRPLKTTISLLPSSRLQNFDHQSRHSGHGIMCKRQGKTMLGTKSKWTPLRQLGLQELEVKVVEVRGCVCESSCPSP